MSIQGQTVVDFGAFPGKSDASIFVATPISSSSLVEAWIPAVATTDHSVDEHWVDPPYVTAGNISASSGFTIYARSQGQLTNYVETDNRYYRYLKPDSLTISVFGPQSYIPNSAQSSPLVYGQWTVFWVWN